MNSGSLTPLFLSLLTSEGFTLNVKCPRYSRASMLSMWAGKVQEAQAHIAPLAKGDLKYMHLNL